MSDTEANALEAKLQHGLTLHRQGRFVDAERIYREVLQQQSNHADALHLLGVVALQTQRPALAADLIAKAVSLGPDSAGAYYNHATALQMLGRIDEAVASYAKAIALNPDYVEAHYHHGNVLLLLQRPGEAVASYDKAIALKADIAEVHNYRGHAMQMLQRHAEAIDSYDKAIALKPDYAEAYFNRGNVLRALHRTDDAIDSYDKAVALKPDYAEAYNDRGVALHELERPDEAIASYDTAIVLRPDNADVHINRGIALQDSGRDAAALASYRRAIELGSDSAQAHLNSAMCLLKLGDLPGGWAEYEWRWKTAHFVPELREFTQPLWLGTESLADRTVLLHHEQGFGDTLQFCRYAPRLAARGAHVVLQVQRPLARLIASLGIGTVVAAGDTLPPFDLHCPLISLPLAFKTMLETIPAWESYLAADPNQVAAWRQRLAALPGRHVGLVWSGSAAHQWPELVARDNRRSIELARLAPLATVPGISFVSLQKGDAAAQARSLPATMEVHDFTDELTDFADTAALVAALDLVITVDTAVAHLAGAMGKPVWILNRFDSCWRWLLDRADSPWYPSARLFRQPALGDWESVIAQVVVALRNERV